MRTTVTFDADVAAAVDRHRREQSVGVSEAVNELVRAGLAAKRPRRRFEQRSERLGLRIDITNVAEALDVLDNADAR